MLPGEVSFSQCGDKGLGLEEGLEVDFGGLAGFVAKGSTGAVRR